MDSERRERRRKKTLSNLDKYKQIEFIWKFQFLKYILNKLKRDKINDTF